MCCEMNRVSNSSSVGTSFFSITPLMARNRSRSSPQRFAPDLDCTGDFTRSRWLVTAPVVRERLRSPRLRSDSSTAALLLFRTSRALALLCLLLEAGPALVADLVIAGREQVPDVVVLVHAHRLAVCLEDLGDHLGEGPPVAKTVEGARDVFVHRPAPGRGHFLHPVREPE